MSIAPHESFLTIRITEPPARRALSAVSILLPLLCVFTATRGATGAFHATLPGFLSLTLGVLVAFTATMFRLLWLRTGGATTRPQHRWRLFGVPLVCVVCMSIALSLSTANGVVLFAIWFVAATEELVWWYALLLGHDRLWRPAVRQSIGLQPAVSVEPGLETPPAAARADQEEALPRSVTQQITRSQCGEEGEVVAGILRAEFAPGERTQHLHVAFCPPLEYHPQVATYQLEGPAATIKVGQAETFGARIDVRLASQPSHHDTLVIGFEVRQRAIGK